VRVAKQEFKQFYELFEKSSRRSTGIAESARNVVADPSERLRIESSLTRDAGHQPDRDGASRPAIQSSQSGDR